MSILEVIFYWKAKIRKKYEFECYICQKGLLEKKSFSNDPFTKDTTKGGQVACTLSEFQSCLSYMW